MLRACFRTATLYSRPCSGRILLYLHDSTSYATAASHKGKARAVDGPIADSADQLEVQGARILRAVRGKMEERGRLLREMVCAQVGSSTCGPY